MLNPPTDNAGPRPPTRGLLDSGETKEEKGEEEATFIETSSGARRHTRDSDTCAQMRLEWSSALPRQGQWGGDAMTCPRPHWPGQDGDPSSLAPRPALSTTTQGRMSSLPRNTSPWPSGALLDSSTQEHPGKGPSPETPIGSGRSESLWSVDLQPST